MTMFFVACFVHLLSNTGWNQQNRKMAINPADKAYMPIYKLAVFISNTCNTKCMTPLPLLPSHHFLNIICHFLWRVIDSCYQLCVLADTVIK